MNRTEVKEQHATLTSGYAGPEAAVQPQRGRTQRLGSSSLGCRGQGATVDSSSDCRPRLNHFTLYTVAVSSMLFSLLCTLSCLLIVSPAAFVEQSHSRCIK